METDYTPGGEEKTARPIDRLLEEYGESHRNETNKAVHWVCVPVIVWTVIALIWSIPSPFADPLLNWTTPVFAAAMLYYIWLSPPLAIGFAAYAILSVVVIRIYETSVSLPLWQAALGIFALAWIGQFWGHKIEGKKPSFFKDIQFLLIGPAWLLSFLYKRWGIRY